MIAPEVLDAMLAAGCTAEQIVAAVKADAEIECRKREADLERKRAANAERQQRFRDRRKGRKGRDNAGNDDNALRDVTPPNDIYSNPPVSSGDETSVPARKPKSGQIAKPEGVSEQTWADFAAHRKRLKAPVSETALSTIRREAEKAGWTLEDALARCVARGWRGFEAKWVADEQKSTGPPGSRDDYLAHFQTKKPLQGAIP